MVRSVHKDTPAPHWTLPEPQCTNHEHAITASRTLDRPCGANALYVGSIGFCRSLLTLAGVVDVPSRSSSTTEKASPNRHRRQPIAVPATYRPPAKVQVTSIVFCDSMLAAQPFLPNWGVLDAQHRAQFHVSWAPSRVTDPSQRRVRYPGIG